MMFSFKENFWLIVPVLIIIPMIATTIIVHEEEEKNITEIAKDSTINENEFKAKEISSSIQFTFNLVESNVDFLLASATIDGIVSDTEEKNIIAVFDELNKIVPMSIILIDKDFKAYYGLGDESIPINLSVKESFNDIDFSDTKNEINHIFKNSKALVIFSQPYSNSEGFVGMALTVFYLEDLVKIHGNIETEDEQFLFLIDKNYDILVDPVLVGENLFGNKVIDYIGMEKNEAKHYEEVLEKNQFFTSVYTNNFGERIDTGAPITINDEIEYYLFVITPTAVLHEMIGNMTLTDQVQTVAILLITGFFIIGFSLKQRKKIKIDKLIMIGHLSSNIAHDIRNPLGAIRNSSIIIDKENNNQNEKISRELKRLKISTKRISHQIEEVLNYVRTTPLHLRKTSLLETIKDAVETIDVPGNVHVGLPENDIKFSYDQEKILIVFVNVILNAIQAIDEKQGHVRIRINEKKSHVTVDIENSGPAISDNVLPKLFEPLFTTRLKGTGLGLSSCKNIINQHKGDISVTLNPVIFSIKISKNLQ